MTARRRTPKATPHTRPALVELVDLLKDNPTAAAEVAELARLTKRFRAGIAAIAKRPDALERLTLVADLMTRLTARRKPAVAPTIREDWYARWKIADTARRTDATFRNDGDGYGNGSAWAMLDKAINVAPDRELAGMLDAVLSVASEHVVSALLPMRDAEERMLAEYHADRKRGTA